MRVVDAKRLHTLVHPKVDHVAAGFPHALAIGAPEVERVDVFVLLGWIFRVANAAVDAHVEPIGVLFDPWVIG